MNTSKADRKINGRYWNTDEIERFEWALNQHGKNYAKIAEHVKTRSHQAIVHRFFAYVKDKSAYEPFHWTADEKQKFADAVIKFGNNRQKISEFVGSKSADKVRIRIQQIR